MQTTPSELVADVERRLDEIEALPDGGAREQATAAVGAVVALYGAGLERIVDELAARDDGQLAEVMAGDELISHLLLLHGLHPLPLAERVKQALNEVRPYLESHGGDVELLGIEETAVRLRLQGSCSGCPSSAMTLKLAIENSIRKTAPEIEEVVAEEHAAAPPLQIEVVHPAGEPWTVVGTLRELSAGDVVVKQVGGEPILFLSYQQQFYAYRSRCPICGESLGDSRVRGSELTCGGCKSRYDVIRAGRCLDSPQLHLEPVPLLQDDDGLVKIALPVVA